MAISHSNFKAIMERIASENDLKSKDLFNQIQDLYQASAPWGSKAAKELASKEKIEVSKIEATGKGGKITLNDAHPRQCLVGL